MLDIGAAILALAWTTQALAQATPSPVDSPLLLGLTKDEWGVVVPVAAAIVGLTTWLAGQYRDRQRKNFEIFFKYREEFRKNCNFVQIFNVFDDPAYDMSTLNTDHLVEMAAFFEELAVLVQSKIIPLPLALYFFGWYIIQMTNDERFTVYLKDYLSEDYWRLLYQFGKRLKEEEARLRSGSHHYIRTLRV